MDWEKDVSVRKVKKDPTEIMSLRRIRWVSPQNVLT